MPYNKIRKKCIEYVVYHEFAHFLEANHSSKFYGEVAKGLPRLKRIQKQIKSEINIR